MIEKLKLFYTYSLFYTHFTHIKNVHKSTFNFIFLVQNKYFLQLWNKNYEWNISLFVISLEFLNSQLCWKKFGLKNFIWFTYTYFTYAWVQIYSYIVTLDCRCPNYIAACVVTYVVPTYLYEFWALSTSTPASVYSVLMDRSLSQAIDSFLLLMYEIPRQGKLNEFF